MFSFKKPAQVLTEITTTKLGPRRTTTTTTKITIKLKMKKTTTTTNRKRKAGEDGKGGQRKGGQKGVIKESYSDLPTVCLSVFYIPFSTSHCLSVTLFLVADTRLYTLVCRSVGPSIHRSVPNIFELRADFALLLLPNRRVRDWIAVYPALFFTLSLFHSPRIINEWIHRIHRGSNSELRGLFSLVNTLCICVLISRSQPYKRASQGAGLFNCQ